MENVAPGRNRRRANPFFSCTHLFSIPFLLAPGAVMAQQLAVDINCISDAGVGDKIGTIVVSESKAAVSFKVAVTGLPKAVGATSQPCRCDARLSKSSPRPELLPWRSFIHEADRRPDRLSAVRTRAPAIRRQRARRA